MTDQDTQGASKTTEAAAEFVQNITYDAVPAEALRIGTRCLIDGLGLFVAGSEEHSVKILADEARAIGGKPEALLLGRGDAKVPAPMAARVLGTAGHAHDWDDSQVSRDPAHVYGLLTHPTIPPLTSALVVAQKLGAVDVSYRVRGRVQDFRMDAAAALPARHAFERHRRNFWRLCGGGKVTES